MPTDSPDYLRGVEAAIAWLRDGDDAAAYLSDAMATALLPSPKPPTVREVVAAFIAQPTRQGGSIGWVSDSLEETWPTLAKFLVDLEAALARESTAPDERDKRIAELEADLAVACSARDMHFRDWQEAERMLSALESAPAPEAKRDVTAEIKALLDEAGSAQIEASAIESVGFALDALHKIESLLRTGRVSPPAGRDVTAEVRTLADDGASAAIRAERANDGRLAALEALDAITRILSTGRVSAPDDGAVEALCEAAEALLRRNIAQGKSAMREVRLVREALARVRASQAAKGESK